MSDNLSMRKRHMERTTRSCQRDDCDVLNVTRWNARSTRFYFFRISHWPGWIVRYNLITYIFGRLMHSSRHLLVNKTGFCNTLKTRSCASGVRTFCILLSSSDALVQTRMRFFLINSAEIRTTVYCFIPGKLFQRPFVFTAHV